MLRSSNAFYKTNYADELNQKQDSKKLSRRMRKIKGRKGSRLRLRKPMQDGRRSLPAIKGMHVVGMRAAEQEEMEIGFNRILNVPATK